MALTNTGFTNYTGWSHHTNDQSPSKIGTYKHSSKTTYLTSVVAKLGTGADGNKFTNSSGAVNKGDGKNISAKVLIYKGSSSSSMASSTTITIKATVSSKQDSSGYWYGDVKNDCASYDFTFDTPVKLEKNTEYTLKIQWSGGAILCFSKEEDIEGDVTYDDGVVYIYNGSTWKKAVPYIYNGSAWKKCVPYIYNGSVWKKCGS